MLCYYQPWLFPFLKTKPDRLPGSVTRYYYLSFEDGLWDLLRQKFPGRKLRFLVPDFYCSDVLDNIKARGHKYTYYPLDNNFQVSASLFRRYLWLYRPDVVIIFHACGITSDLVTDWTWLSDLPPGSLLIEDSVHRLVNPARIKFLTDNHFIIDSLRKVSPLPGSRMFVKSPEVFCPNQVNPFLSAYSMKAAFLYFVFRLLQTFGFIFNSSVLLGFAHEHLLRVHDDLVGDSPLPHGGFLINKFLSKYFNHSRIEGLKRTQTGWYRKYFQQVFKSDQFYPVSIPPSDYGFLHVYPLGFNHPPSQNLITYLHSKNIPVWFKFTDSPWSQKRGVLFLPLGFHVSETQVRFLAGTLLDFIQLSE